MLPPRAPRPWPSLLTELCSHTMADSQPYVGLTAEPASVAAPVCLDTVAIGAGGAGAGGTGGGAAVHRAAWPAGWLPWQLA